MRRRDWLATGAGVVALGCAVILALSLVWARVSSGWSTFGLDLLAYEAAADRLVETGSPYSVELAAGPIANDAVNVTIGYFYPPPLAQAFTMIRGIDHSLLATAWTILQVAIAFLLLPLVWRRSGGKPGVTPLIWVAALAIGSAPFQLSLVIGNVSGWSALIVAGLLVTKPYRQGALAGGLGLLKPTNAPIVLVSLLQRGSRLPALALVLGVFVASFAIAPRAWWAWFDVLPNVLRLPPGGSPGSVSLASMFRGTPISNLAAIASTVIGAACVVVAVWLARREGLSRRVVTAASTSTLMLNSTLWDHYLAVMVPIAIAAWPNVSDRWRFLLLFGSLTHVLAWFGPFGALRAAVMFGGFVAITFASVFGDVPGKGPLHGPAGSRRAESQGPAD